MKAGDAFKTIKYTSVFSACGLRSEDLTYTIFYKFMMETAGCISDEITFMPAP